MSSGHRARLAAFPKCWIEKIVSGEMTVFEWIDRSVELEPEGLELYSGFLTSLESRYLREVRRRIESHGFTMPMLCYSPDFTKPDAAERSREIESQRGMIRATAELGGTFCRTLSGQRRPGVSDREGAEWVVAAIEACLPEAERCGVVLVMENHFKDGYWTHREFAQRMEHFLPIVRSIRSDWFGVQYDPSNALVAGDDPVALLEAVLPLVRTMHASDRSLIPGASLDALRQADGTLGYPKELVHGVTGRGAVDYPSIFSRLRDGGFQGWISIEDGMNGLEEMRESLDFLRDMRSRYGL